MDERRLHKLSSERCALMHDFKIGILNRGLNPIKVPNPPLIFFAAFVRFQIIWCLFFATILEIVASLTLYSRAICAAVFRSKRMFSMISLR